MDMFDKARAIRGTLELCGITQKELGKRLGVSQSYIANKLRLLDYSDRLVTLIRECGLSERHARSILRLEGERERERMIRKVAEGSLSVRECEALVDSSVEPNLPILIGKAGKIERISLFKDTLRKSVETLCSLGIEAKSTTSCYGEKTYITVMIGER